MNRIELIKFYDYLSDQGIINSDETGKAFRWIDNYVNRTKTMSDQRFEREQRRLKTSQLKKAVSEKHKYYKSLIGHPDFNTIVEQNAAQTLVRELGYLDSICEFEEFN